MPMVNFGDSMNNARRQVLKETREKDFMDRLNERKEKEAHAKVVNNDPSVQLNRKGFFGQENVQQYNKEMITRLFDYRANKKMGRGMFFDTPEELAEWMYSFFDLCSRTAITPTVSGLCCYLKCGSETLKIHANNPDSPFYELCNSALQYCHAALEIGATEGKLNSVAYIFQAKNSFNMRDQQEIAVHTNTERELINSEETLKALKEQQEREERVQKLLDVKDADFEEVISANF